MRIHLSSMAHPKRLAKRIAKKGSIPLHRAQDACAYMFGYKDWHELEQVTAAQLNPPSKPDWLLPSEIVQTRRNAFGNRLGIFLQFPEGSGWSEIWDFVDDLQPMGSIPDQACFTDPWVSEIFPVSWELTDEAISYFDDIPPDRFHVSVGRAASREFEDILKSGVNISKVPNRINLIPEDRFGYRTFILSVGDMSGYPDFKPTVPGIAMIPFRFMPVICEGVLLELEIHIHPGALASHYISNETCDYFADSIIAYLRESAIWGLSSGVVCGATNGIALTISGVVTSSPVARIIEALENKLNDHEEGFDPNMEFDMQEQVFLPIREFMDDCAIEVSLEDTRDDYICQNQDDVVSRLVKETVALSHAPEMLSRVLSGNGFGQYAEFCHGMSLTTFEDKKRFSAFVCSMERAKALSRPHSIFFRHYMVDRLIGEEERKRGIPGPNFEPLDVSIIAMLAKSLGDDEMAELIRTNYDSVFALCRIAADELEGLIDEFGQTTAG